MEDIIEKENRFRFLLSKIDGEISKFKIKQTTLEQKIQDIKQVTKSFDEQVPIALNAENQENVYELLKAHLIELENLKSYISQELSKIEKQKKIEKELKSQFNDNIKVEQNQLGGFKINYKDEDINKIADEAIISKKLISSLKENIFNKK
jgi:thioester reductase-like protein